ncbi:hypothetical protein A2164_02405 [Candidatus Curtissbacteria bacterium RBG_13_35_7]|uniref:PDZ domain-containing protein n=1 Tax=Candidatus Curtissbacteria bacterium RBG_13_35_7 TaxID=1797705 RepID=A0A1F5G3T2_9BACT|nr:MAG: hypothetical protein A2164_02405 [Candidatus Curtissbacteria bacterium RBG_13_35_7]
MGQKKVEISRKNIVPTINILNQSPADTQNVDFSLFWEVFKILPEKYLDKSAVDGQKMLYGAISGMVRSLGDPYTAFLDPKQNELIKTDIAGSYEGVGIQIGFNEDKRLTVIAPLKGTPAEREGLLAKDLILKIDDIDTFEMTLPEAVEKIRGTAGTRVKLQLLREDETEPFEKEIERAQIDVKTVDLEYRNVENGEIAIISVSRFGDKTDMEWDSAVEEIISKDVDGVIVDMRNNPGGLLTSSIYLAGDFVKGTIVKQKLSNGSIQSLPPSGQGRLLKIKTIILINEGSASAAEIFAGAIQDKRRGQLIGEKTFGKGTVQDVVDLPGGSGLHVTIANWLTPNENSIHGVGITPDIVIEMTKEDRQNDKDPQLDKALEVI